MTLRRNQYLDILKIDPLVCDCDLTLNNRVTNALSEGADDMSPLFNAKIQRTSATTQFYWKGERESMSLQLAFPCHLRAMRLSNNASSDGRHARATHHA